PAGPAAIETLIGEGINVNVTLIFSIAQYEAVAEAYLRGLEKRADTSSGGGDLRQVASVASFFVSRVDTATDQALDKLGDADLKGKAAIANAKAAYARFCQLFSGPRWQRLALRGAQVQRPLWASTGTKNPHYPDTLYVDSLIGPDTVNTIPPATLTAFLDHGVVAPTLAAGMDEAQETLARLAIAGVDLKAITEQLQKDAVAAFAQSFETLTASIGEKRQRLLAPKVIFDSRFLIDNQKSKISNQELPTLTGWPHITYALGAHQPPVERALADIKADQIISRIWSRDYTVWKPEPAEIANRLGWLHIAEMMSEHLQPLRALADSARAAGYTHALLLGMGGSSLAPDLFRRTFGVADGYLDLAVLDSTDPGSQLAEVAAQYRFRAALLNDPNIGGRYSALSTFGLAPAALMGVDVPRLLERALRAASACEPCVAAADNPGARLGAAMGELAQAGRDKITFDRLRGRQARRHGAGRAHSGRASVDSCTPAKPLRSGWPALPLGVRDGGGRLAAGHQPLRPAQRRVGQGLDAADIGR
ncbi:MAG: hypothetical protein HYR71_00295, partial [Chloroflexi bacterium]|nr:hypothetical protein [Chloroflexota bacterium]